MTHKPTSSGPLAVWASGRPASCCVLRVRTPRHATPSTKHRARGDRVGYSLLALLLPLAACTASAPRAPAVDPPGGLTAESIVQRAFDASGGETWRRPRTLRLRGTATVYPDGVRARATTLDDYRMHRVFPSEGGAAHQANGQVRFEGWAGGARAFLISYDGATTYTASGPVPVDDAEARWSAAFGFGVLRFALDDGFAVDRLADLAVDGHPACRVRVTDPAGTVTLFAVARDDARVLQVGFDTPQGWHERIYSDFSWVDAQGGGRFRQPGRVRLVYDGVLERDIRWTEAAVNEALDPALFSSY